METFKGFVVILLTSVLVNNYVLSRFLGICPFLGVSKKLNQAAGMGAAVIFVMLMATAATWPIQTFLLDKFGLGYLRTIVFILVIASLVQLVEIILKKYLYSLISAICLLRPRFLYDSPKPHSRKSVHGLCRPIRRSRETQKRLCVSCKYLCKLGSGHTLYIP